MGQVAKGEWRMPADPRTHHAARRQASSIQVAGRQAGIQQRGKAGINVRGEGGYVIVPPSKIIDGRSYAMADPINFFDFADAPEWLYDLILPASRANPRQVATVSQPIGRAYADAAIRGEVAAVSSAPPGRRNNQLNESSFALGTLVGVGILAEDEVVVAMIEGATASGLLAEEGQASCIATINSGLRSGIAAPRALDSDQPSWREQSKGKPKPSMHNARLAIEALGIKCSYDIFHGKILFGYQGDVPHEMQFIIGQEVSDNGIIRLRQLISDRFGADLGDQAVRDGVVSLALEHCFDPICDELDLAEANYDGVPRLDRMAVDYLNADDTPLNRAIIRITMIAAVRRARHPGCKFDTITVLESPEGWNKSTVWRVIAGDENYSDESILGKQTREVQEQLSPIWIHENAELAGMKKAEVESVKAFASRQEDIARPAYGHFVKKQPRHSIDVGTTNSDEYLQSQTGNRRFWPVAIRRRIDIDLLRRDRLQLLGEAATHESRGDSIVLDEALWPAAATEQERRRTKDSWEDIVADMPSHVYVDAFGHIEHVHEGQDEVREEFHIRIIHREIDRDVVASADLLRYVLGIPIGRQTTRDSMRLATVMRLAGWERGTAGITIGGKRVRGYFRPRDTSNPA
jgi:predicted P-loop ATPase